MPAVFIALMLAQAATAAPPPSPPPSVPPGLFDGLFGKMPDQADSSADARAGRDDLSLVVVRSGRFSLGDSVSLYKTARGWCALAEPLLDTLGIDHRVEAAHLVTTLHAPRRAHRVALASLERTPEGACLLLGEAGKLAEAELTYDPVEQTLSVEGGTPVPAVARMEREGSRTRRLEGAKVPTTTYPGYPNESRWAAVPTVDVTLSARVAGGRVAGTAVAEGAGDLFQSTARWRLSASTTAPVQLRGKIERVSPDGGMLGPIDARRIEIGDIGLPAQPMIGAALQGRGLVVSSAPEWRADIFDRLVLSGPLPDGWQAELSIGGRLLAFADAPDANGEYRFADVPVRVGANDFVIDLYGPHGEHVRRSAARQVGSARYPENETSVTFGLVAPIATRDASTPSIPATAIATASAGLAGWASGRIDVRSGLNGSANAASMSLDASLFGGVAGATLAVRRPGGWAGNVMFSRRLGNFSLTGEAQNYGTAPSLWANAEEAATRRLAVLKVDGSLALFGRRVGLSLDLRQTRGRDGISRTGVRTQQSLRLGVLRFDHQLTAETGPAARTLGAVAMAWSRRATTVRMRAGYAWAPTARLTDLALAADTKTSTWTLRAQASYDPAKSVAQVTVGASRKFWNIELSLDGGWGNRGPTAMAGVRFALGKVPGSGFRTLPVGSSRGAIFAPRLTDDGARPLKDGRFIVGNTLRPEKAGRDGVALIGPMTAYRPTDLALQLSSLDDDRLRPYRPGMSIVGRPGQILSIPIPLHRAGSIEVRLVRRAGDRVEPVVGVPVSFTDAAGEVRMALTDFDGFALVDGVLLGRYSVTAQFDGHSAQSSVEIGASNMDATTTLTL